MTTHSTVGGASNEVQAWPHNFARVVHEQQPVSTWSVSQTRIFQLEGSRWYLQSPEVPLMILGLCVVRVLYRLFELDRSGGIAHVLALPNGGLDVLSSGTLGVLLAYLGSYPLGVLWLAYRPNRARPPV